MARKPDQTTHKLGKALNRKFFDRSVHDVAPDLIGATLLVDGVGGMIVEVEVYHHTDPAAHSFNGPTPRNRIMFGPAGFAYVYRIHQVFCVNAVCEGEGSASAVLIRALQPTFGLGEMRARRGLEDERILCSGPGRLCQALGIGLAHNGLALDKPPIELFARTEVPDVVAGIRIGISKAVDLPWRYGVRGSKYVSKPFAKL